VEPKYEKKIETLDQLVDSDVVYGYQDVIDFYKEFVSFPEFFKFLEHKRLKTDCNDAPKCVERMITKGDIASVMPPFFATYVAREMGTVDVGKIVCSFEEAFFSAGATILFKKGNPLLGRFNILMRRYLEAGLLERLWTELQHRASLRGAERFREAAGDIFFAFSVSHLMPAFVVLLVGTVLSSVVFIVELIVNCLYKRREKEKNPRIRRVKELCSCHRLHYRYTE
jgi:hypothetical protein